MVAARRKPETTKSAPTQTTQVNPGSVYVQVDMKFSKNYQSGGYTVGLTLPINTGEDAQDAMKRVAGEVHKFYDSTCEGVMDELESTLKSRNRGG